METMQLDLGNPAVITFDIKGDLKLIGHDKPEFLSLSNPERLKIERSKNKVRIQSDRGCRMIVPRNQAIEIVHGWGDVRILSIGGDLKAEDVEGDIKLLEVKNLELKNVKGDVHCVGIKGDVKVDNSSGDLKLVDVNGSVILGAIDGDCSTVRVQKDITITTCQGSCMVTDLGKDLRVDYCNGDLAIVKVSGNVHIKKAEGDIACVDVQGDLQMDVDGDISVSISTEHAKKVNLRSKGDVKVQLVGKASGSFDTESVENGTRLDLAERKETLPESRNTFVLGNGKSSIHIAAAGEILLTQKELHFFHGAIHIPDLSDEMHNIGIDLGDDFSAHIDEKVRLSTEKMALKMEKMGRKAEVRVNAALKKIGHTIRVHSDEGTETDINENDITMNGSEPVSEAERALILKMLQEKKITPAEAEKLLEALEGNY